MWLVVGELGGLHDVVFRAGVLDLHGVADGAADQREECVEAVGAERGGGQPGDEADVVGEELCVGVGADDRLGGDDVDVAIEFLRLAAVLADGGGVA